MKLFVRLVTGSKTLACAGAQDCAPPFACRSASNFLAYASISRIVVIICMYVINLSMNASRSGSRSGKPAQRRSKSAQTHTRSKLA